MATSPNGTLEDTDTAVDRLYWPVALRERVDRIAARNGITRGEQIVRMIEAETAREESTHER